MCRVARVAAVAWTALGGLVSSASHCDCVMEGGPPVRSSECKTTDTHTLILFDPYHLPLSITMVRRTCTPVDDSSFRQPTNGHTMPEHHVHSHDAEKLSWMPVSADHTTRSETMLASATKQAYHAVPGDHTTRWNRCGIHDLLCQYAAGTCTFGSVFSQNWMVTLV